MGCLGVGANSGDPDITRPLPPVSIQHAEAAKQPRSRPLHIQLTPVNLFQHPFNLRTAGMN